ncbi:MAG: [protein-PII] uridylyltransferase [Alphaproteobacteria bacterium]
MDAVHNHRQIINRRQLLAAIDVFYADRGDEVARRAKVLTCLKSALATGQTEIQRRFVDEHAGGEATVRATTLLVDQLLRTIYQLASEREYPGPNPTQADRLAAVAVGGYGRGEMAPFSDIDLLFVLPYKRTPRSEQIVEYVLYMLWDLGLKVGHATRSLDECIRLARKDLTIRTSLLESRYLSGDQPLYLELRQRFADEVVAGTAMAFVEAKLTERDARHKRLGDSRYVLEPNIKEGKGGLRDLQTLYWIGKYVYRVDNVDELVAHKVLTEREVKRFAKAQNFLWAVRCHLHYLAGRAEERLTFDVQPEIAELLGYTDHRGALGVERFMKHYYLVAKDVGDLTRIFCASIEAEHKPRPLLRFPRLRRRAHLKGFKLDAGRLNIDDPHLFRDDPVAMLRLFHVSHETGIETHPFALRKLTQNLRRVDKAMRDDPEAIRLFAELVASETDPEIALRHMNEAGLLGRFLPDFGRVVGQMQHDMYHVFTVDEHTVRALGILHRIELGLYGEEHPLSTKIIHKLQSRRALYFGLLFHDIAKGRGGDHSVLGAKIAERACPRLGLDAEETETVAWLVRHHLIMSNTAFKRDLSDPQTIANFIAIVQSPERLRLLICLTVADIRAVGPKVWNNWKAALLRELYYAAEAMMSDGQDVTNRDDRVAEAQAALRKTLSDWPDAAVDSHLGRGYPGYWLAFDTATLARHARQMRDAEQRQAPLSIDTRIDVARAITEVTIYTLDHPGVFSAISGAMAACGANIVDARIYTTPHGMDLDSFYVQDEAGGAFDQPERLARLSVLVERSLSGRLRAEEVKSNAAFAPQRNNIFRVQPRVLIDNRASATHTMIEVNGRDRPGFLYHVTMALTDLGLQVANAKVSTFGERAVDTFYVKDGFGMKILHKTRLQRIREKLLEVLTALADDPADNATGSTKRAKPTRRRPTKKAQASTGQVG